MQSYNQRVRGDGKSRSIPKHVMGSSSLSQSMFDMKQNIVYAQSLEDYKEYNISFCSVMICCVGIDKEVQHVFTDMTGTKKTSNLGHIDEHGQHT